MINGLISGELRRCRCKRCCAAARPEGRLWWGLVRRAPGNGRILAPVDASETGRGIYRGSDFFGVYTFEPDEWESLDAPS